MRISMDKLAVDLWRGWFMKRVLAVLCLFVAAIRVLRKKTQGPRLLNSKRR